MKSGYAATVTAFRLRTLQGTPNLAVEDLEGRRLFCYLHTGDAADGITQAPTAAVIQAALAAAAKKTSVVSDHSGGWYKPVKTVTIDTGKTAAAKNGSVAVRNAADAALSATPIASAASFPVNAAGLPILSSRADGAGLKIFLDFDGYNSDIPFDMTVAQGGDANGATFNPKEQTVIYNAWRDIVSYYAMYDVNVTTVQPPVGGTNPAFVWQRITDSVSGGAAYVGAINNSQSNGWTDDSNAISRTSGIAHEIGHQLNLQHQSDWNNDATKLNEYTNGYAAHGSIIGIDYGQEVHKWWYGRNSTSATTFQNDLNVSAAYIKSKYATSVDGFMPDDYTATTFGSATAMATVSGAFSATGTIERVADADIFSFTSDGSAYDVGVIPYVRSALAPKFELYTAAGQLVTAKDDTSLRALGDNGNEEVKLTLPAGAYYLKVLGHGDYGDVGEYAAVATPLPAGWNTTDVLTTTGGMGFSGSAAYNAATKVFTQTAGGVGVSGSADAMRYSYVTLSGDGSITAKLDSLTSDTVTSTPRAGLVLRESLGGNGRMAYVEYSPTNATYGYRSAVGGGVTAGTATGLAVGNWLRITRTGASYTLATSPDGVNFVTLYSSTLTSLANTIYLGLSTASRDKIHATTAAFSNVAYTGTLATTAVTTNGLTAPAMAFSGPVAAQSTGMNINWTDANTTESGFAVERSNDGVTWSRIATTATNVTTYTDTPAFGAMRWWYRVAALTAAGQSDYSDVISVVNKPAAPTNFQAVDVNANYLSLTWRDVSGETGYRVERSTDGGATYTTVAANTGANIVGFNMTGLTANTAYTVRVTPLSDAGDGVPLVVTKTTLITGAPTVTFTTKQIANVGLSWTAVVGATSYRIDRSTDKTSWATVGTTTGATIFTDTTATTALTHYYYRVVGTATGTQSGYSAVVFCATPSATANPAEWTDADVGTVGGSGAGFITPSAGTATVIGGGGTYLTNSTDQFNFLYTPLTGDGQIVARVAGVEAINDYSKAGVMMRNTPDNNSTFAAAFYQSAGGAQGTKMNYRTIASGAGTIAGAATDSTYRWLKLTRAGNVFTAYDSTTGVDGTWVTMGSVTIAMNPTIYLGLAASPYDNSYLTKATFDNISYTAAAVAPTLASSVVNGGVAQRSMVKTMALNFSQPVALGTGAITLLKKQTDGSYAASTEPYTVTPAVGGTTYASAYTVTFTGTGGSIGDGSYRFGLKASAITTSASKPMATDTSIDFYRLFGDADGDGGVSINDFNAFATAFGSVGGTSAYNGAFDSDGDFGISINDFNAFATRFGVTV